MSLFGVDPLDEGRMTLRGRPLIVKSPIETVKLGLGLVPGNRILQGVTLKAPLRNNITLPFIHRLAGLGFIKSKEKLGIVRKYIDYLKIKTPSDDTEQMKSNGGQRNQGFTA